MERTERICAMEARMDRVAAALAAGHRADAEEDRQILEAYYTDGDWLSDYEADERGELPAGLKRGVLSQDGLYNLLEEWNTIQNEGEGR